MGAVTQAACKRKGSEGGDYALCSLWGYSCGYVYLITFLRVYSVHFVIFSENFIFFRDFAKNKC